MAFEDTSYALRLNYPWDLILCSPLQLVAPNLTPGKFYILDLIPLILPAQCPAQLPAHHLCLSTMSCSVTISWQRRTHYNCCNTLMAEYGMTHELASRTDMASREDGTATEIASCVNEQGI